MQRGSSSSPFSAGDVVAQKYRLIKQLGEGAMGVVWLAVNESTGGEVALKLIVRPEAELRQRLLREARACCAIRHRNVIQIHDVGTTSDGDPFLVMELLAGETLAEMLVRRRRLGQEEAATIGRDIARALAAAHDKEIVHRDLKPANIFLHHEPGGDGYVVKVLDFGVSKSLVATEGHRTVVGATVGSPMYMSPEQANADPTTDGRSDIWSLGVVLFEMLTGQKPFTGESMEVLKHVLTGYIPTVSRRVRKVDPAFEQIITACMQRRRELRPWPASELAKQLEPFASPGARGQLPSHSDSWSAADGGGVPADRRPAAPPAAPPPPLTAPLDHDSVDHDPDDDAATRPIQPRMLADIRRPPAPAAGRGGTVPILPPILPVIASAPPAPEDLGAKATVIIADGAQEAGSTPASTFRGTVRLEGPGVSRPADDAPGAFAPASPPVTSSDAGVWERLTGLTRDTAARHGTKRAVWIAGGVIATCAFAAILSLVAIPLADATDSIEPPAAPPAASESPAPAPPAEEESAAPPAASKPDTPPAAPPGSASASSSTADAGAPKTSAGDAGPPNVVTVRRPRGPMPAPCKCVNRHFTPRCCPPASPGSP